MNTRAKYAMAAVPLSVAILWSVLYYGDMNVNPISHSDSQVAVYDHVRFYGYPNFVRVSVDSVSEARLYIALPDERRFLLRDLPEEAAIKYTSEKIDRREDPVQPTNAVAYKSGTTRIEYHEGKLHHCNFEFPEGTFRFSPRLEGPYLELPADTEQLIDVFGEPREWQRPGPSGPPF